MGGGGVKITGGRGGGVYFFSRKVEEAGRVFRDNILINAMLLIKPFLLPFGIIVTCLGNLHGNLYSYKVKHILRFIHLDHLLVYQGRT